MSYMTCVECRRGIAPGVKVVWGPGRGDMMHEHCAQLAKANGRDTPTLRKTRKAIDANTCNGCGNLKMSHAQVTDVGGQIVLVCPTAWYHHA